MSAADRTRAVIAAGRLLHDIISDRPLGDLKERAQKLWRHFPNGYDLIDPAKALAPTRGNVSSCPVCKELDDMAIHLCEDTHGKQEA